MIDPSVSQGRFENLAQRHDFLMHGVMRLRFAEHRLAFFKPMDAIFIPIRLSIVPIFLRVSSSHDPR
jgi:hypothetical protein